ncbi:MAG: helix-turn-helix domain-containing protein [Alphaproteobacteria bacterium]
MITERRLLAIKDHAIKIVASYAGVPEAELVSRTRRKQVAQARQIAIALVADIAGVPQTRLGKLFGKDHTTVGFAIQAVAHRNAYPSDEDYQRLLAQLVSAMTCFDRDAAMSDDALREDARKLTGHALVRMENHMDGLIMRNPTLAIQKISQLLIAIESPIP